MALDKETWRISWIVGVRGSLCSRSLPVVKARRRARAIEAAPIEAAATAAKLDA